ncbi:glycerophosphodiester phosphodiesterase [Paenibacillus qinlingensis]|uniref:Glycerophosphoryl diester phosphodiesterase n=1 Tax=Paenibacillus qinlingensis TaxID=1837343 RepID=A0ABU1P6J0_9BACL|nr:glycerophosphodiester phosphodiesterase [Paenibacillus qinlingensis]MDR6555380.1 glycerophosphoryl diester phosphodiesterase [Paenibacillus qinlingensis]
MPTSKPIIIGHRGAAGEAPENTLASFALALEQGAQAIELDVHLTRDGKIVVCHDGTLNRTTNGSGLIAHQSWEDIRKLDAGAWFSEKFLGERIPLLSEVFDLVPRGTLINVEVKDAYEGRMESALLAFLRERDDRYEDVVVSSFDHKVIQRLKRAEPALKVGLLYAANLIDHAGYAKLLDVDVYSLHPHYHSFAEADIAMATTAGLAVYPYTVNELSDYQMMITAGVTGIITDFPGRLKAYLNT